MANSVNDSVLVLVFQHLLDVSHVGLLVVVDPATASGDDFNGVWRRLSWRVRLKEPSLLICPC